MGFIAATLSFEWANAGSGLSTELVASGFTMPLYVTAPPGDTARLFVVEQHDDDIGRIKIVDSATGAVNATPFLTIAPVSTGFEQGLLGLAFDPDYASNGFFYVNYTDAVGTTIVRRYSVSGDPNVADPDSGLTLLTIAQPFENHNGGWIGFGPDGFLYIATGDGGSANDPGNRAQDTSVQLGKMLRIDPDGDDFPLDPLRHYAIPAGNPFAGGGGDAAIWAYGLRNPWRSSFDRLTGDLYIGDVGQDLYEEIDIQPAAGTGGLNYGWRCMEGFHCTGLTGCICNDASLTLPVHEIFHGDGHCSVTGGYVYRGSAIPAMQGAYFFADYCSGHIWSFKWVGGVVTELTDRTTELAPSGFTINNITSFGEDAAGELYICDQGGEIFRVVAGAGECLGDIDGSGTVDGFDITVVLAQWGDCTGCGGDLNKDGTVDGFDITFLLGAWGPCTAE